MYKVFINKKEIILIERLPENLPAKAQTVKVESKNDFFVNIDAFLNNAKKDINYLYVLNDSGLSFSYLKDYSIYIEAAGGLVKNPLNYLLFIYRYGKWDLPKGKKKPGEDPEKTAIREVTEECGVGELKILSQLVPTYHMYTLPSQQWALKKTFWYLMIAGDWKNTSPQQEEDISEVVWVNPSEVYKYLANTYASIRMLIKEYCGI